MKLLCLDTSTDACTVALGTGTEVMGEWSDEPRVHARRVLGMVESVLSRAGMTAAMLDAVAVGCGPGSFTGVRIGTGVAQGIAFAAGVPVVRLSSLAMAAATAIRHAGAAPASGLVLVAQDARMGEVYWSAFDLGEPFPELLMQPCVADRLDPPDRVRARLREVSDAPVVLASGSGAEAVFHAAPAAPAAGVAARALPDAVDSLPMAAAVLQRDGGLPPEQAVPVYFRAAV